jgi:DNA-binding winged helix-turn-helix (wHTH) protein/Flp pilus assembly protein TadD
MLKLDQLALRPDLEIGPMLVSPSRRLLEGPGGHAHLEPLIMQVFLLLLDAGGRVVTRNELFDQCWGGVMVSDASLNRTIVRIRRTGDQVAPGLFEIETIPRTGYRLTGNILDCLKEGSAGRPASPPGDAAMSRRRLVGGGLAAAAALGGAGLWWANRPRTDPRFDALMERGEDALRLDEPGAAKYFEQAAAIEPRNARAWGLLAYALGSGGTGGPYEASGLMTEAAERAARRALQIDPNEPNALLAMTFIQRGLLGWISSEDRYRRILAIAPDNIRVIQSLGLLLSGVGRCREALAMTERATAIEPLAPDLERRKAMSLWINGRIREADQVSDRAMQLWPSHRLVRMARLMIYAFTARTQAALAMVEEEEARPLLLSSSAAAVWRVSLAALEDRSSSNVASARKANLEGSRATPATSAYAILILSAIGELDAAFDVANGFLLGRGSVIVRPRPENRVPAVNGPGWRNTFGLFTPPTKAMRLDPRFGPLADGLGLTDYWRRRGIGPDAFLFKS